VCANLLTSTTNCGGCGVGCGGVCVNGTCQASTLFCQAGLTACGSVCSDLSSDPSNCGACGHRCTQFTNQAIACVAGACLGCPSPSVQCTSTDPFNPQECADLQVANENCGACGVVCASGQVCLHGACVARSAAALATGLAVSDMAVDGTSIFFVDSMGGTVNSLPAGGGQITVLTSAARPVHLALDSQYVYYSAYLGGAVMRVPKTGGTAAVVAVATQPNEILVDAQNVYWVNVMPGTMSLSQAPKTGGTATTIFNTAVLNTGIISLYQNSTTVFFETGFGTGSFACYAMPKATLVPGTGPCAFARDDTYAYDVALNQSNQPQGALSVQPISGSGPTLTLWPLAQPPIVADGTDIFFAGYDGNGSDGGNMGIREVHYCNNTTAAVLLDVTPTLLALDASYVYWSEGTMIGRVPK
jgi:hypothetical protein